MTNKELIKNFKEFINFGFDIIKTNGEQIYISRKDNKMYEAVVLINGIDYKTPKADVWYSIEEEIKRLEKENK